MLKYLVYPLLFLEFDTWYSDCFLSGEDQHTSAQAGLGARSGTIYNVDMVSLNNDMIQDWVADPGPTIFIIFSQTQTK